MEYFRNPWLDKDVRETLTKAIRWCSASVKNPYDSTYRKEGQTVRVRKHKSLALQIVRFEQFEPEIRALLSDTRRVIRVAFTAAAVRAFILKEGRRLTENTTSGLVALIGYEFIIRCHARERHRLTLLVHEVQFIGSVSGGTFGEPNHIEYAPGVEELIEEMSPLQTMSQSPRSQKEVPQREGSIHSQGSGNGSEEGHVDSTMMGGSQAGFATQVPKPRLSKYNLQSAKIIPPPLEPQGVRHSGAAVVFTAREISTQAKKKANYNSNNLISLLGSRAAVKEQAEPAAALTSSSNIPSIKYHTEVQVPRRSMTERSGKDTRLPKPNWEAASTAVDPSDSNGVLRRNTAQTMGHKQLDVVIDGSNSAINLGPLKSMVQDAEDAGTEPVTVTKEVLHTAVGKPQPCVTSMIQAGSSDIHEASAAVNKPIEESKAVNKVLSEERASMPTGEESDLDPWAGMTRIPRREFRIPKEQAELLNKKICWLPPEPGERAPVANIPVPILSSLTDKAERRAQKGREAVEAAMKCLEVAPDSESSTSSDSESDELLSEWSPSPPAQRRFSSLHDMPPDSSPEEASPTALKQRSRLNQRQFNQPTMTKPLAKRENSLDDELSYPGVKRQRIDYDNKKEQYPVKMDYNGAKGNHTLGRESLMRYRERASIGRQASKSGSVAELSDTAEETGFEKPRSSVTVIITERRKESRSPGVPDRPSNILSTGSTFVPIDHGSQASPNMCLSQTISNFANVGVVQVERTELEVNLASLESPTSQRLQNGAGDIAEETCIVLSTQHNNDELDSDEEYEIETSVLAPLEADLEGTLRSRQDSFSSSPVLPSTAPQPAKPVVQVKRTPYESTKAGFSRHNSLASRVSAGSLGHHEGVEFSSDLVIPCTYPNAKRPTEESTPLRGRWPPLAMSCTIDNLDVDFLVSSQLHAEIRSHSKTPSSTSLKQTEGYVSGSPGGRFGVSKRSGAKENIKHSDPGQKNIGTLSMPQQIIGGPVGSVCANIKRMEAASGGRVTNEPETKIQKHDIAATDETIQSRQTTTVSRGSAFAGMKRRASASDSNMSTGPEEKIQIRHMPTTDGAKHGRLAIKDSTGHAFADMERRGSASDSNIFSGPNMEIQRRYTLSADKANQNQQTPKVPTGNAFADMERRAVTPSSKITREPDMGYRKPDPKATNDAAPYRSSVGPSLGSVVADTKRATAVPASKIASEADNSKKHSDFREQCPSTGSRGTENLRQRVAREFAVNAFAITKRRGTVPERKVSSEPESRVHKRHASTNEASSQGQRNKRSALKPLPDFGFAEEATLREGRDAKMEHRLYRREFFRDAMAKRSSVKQTVQQESSALVNLSQLPQTTVAPLTYSVRPGPTDLLVQSTHRGHSNRSGPSLHLAPATPLIGAPSARPANPIEDWLINTSPALSETEDPADEEEQWFHDRNTPFKEFARAYVQLKSVNGTMGTVDEKAGLVIPPRQKIDVLSWNNGYWLPRK